MPALPSNTKTSYLWDRTLVPTSPVTAIIRTWRPKDSGKKSLSKKDLVEGSTTCKSRYFQHARYEPNTDFLPHVLCAQGQRQPHSLTPKDCWECNRMV